MVVLTLLAIAAAFLLSAAAGLGGSLILVPAMAAALGPKEGIALAALLLGLNNVAKVVAYRRTIPVRASVGVVLMTMAGALIGAALLTRLPDAGVQVLLVLSLAITASLERRPEARPRRAAPGLLALGAGASSGVSGVSGPLKGMAIRSLGLDRMHFVGACSLVSMAGDSAKIMVYSQAALMDRTTGLILACSIPLMPLAAALGRYFNERGGERSFRRLFWLVMGGYMVRLAAG